MISGNKQLKAHKDECTRCHEWTIFSKPDYWRIEKHAQIHNDCYMTPWVPSPGRCEVRPPTWRRHSWRVDPRTANSAQVWERHQKKVTKNKWDSRKSMPRACPQKTLTSTVHATPLMTPTTALGLSICLSLFELRETGDWDIFLGPPERARAGGADQWVLKRRECSGFARVKKVTSASLGYPLSVFNKNSTLKEIYQN